jgi:hypothetical protein
MDVYGIEALLGLPEFRVIDQVIRPKRLDVHLGPAGAFEQKVTVLNSDVSS